MNYKSISPSSNGCTEYIADYLSNLGFSIDYVNRGQTTNLIANYGTGSEIFAFAGHVDVVPPGDINAWHGKDPFRLQIVDEQLIGRGVADMKGAIAAFLIALKQFCLNKMPLDQFRIILLITSDEEGDAIDGTPLIVEYLEAQKIKLNYCLVGEPSSVTNLGDTVKIGRRGSLNAKLTILGKQGHIAYPDLCINPIHQFAKLLNDLIDTVWDNGNEYFPATSLQFSNINSGLGATNVIPGQLTAEFNLRYNTEYSEDLLKQRINQIIRNHQIDYELIWAKNPAQPFFTKPDKLGAITALAIEQACQIKPQLKTDGGTSDGRFLAAISDELIEFGLVNATIHQVNETISKADLVKLNEIYYNILNKIFDIEKTSL